MMDSCSSGSINMSVQFYHNSVSAMTYLAHTSRWPLFSAGTVWLGTAITLLIAVVYHFSAQEEAAATYTVPEPSLPSEHKILEDPSIKAPGSTAIQCYAPATGQLLGLVNPSTSEGIDRAIEKAHTAQQTWTRSTFAQRRRVLRSLRAFITTNQDTICRIACLDSGKTMIDAALGEILVTAEKLTWTIKHGKKVLRPSRRGTNLLMAYKRNTVYYEPLGVVAALVSWNYPFHNILGPLISAIFAGNGIVIKASENTAWSAQYFGAIAKGALQACGHDPNLVQIITCWPQTANHLTSHPGISHITFIGSRPVAKLVATSAAKSLIPVLAELGGKDAAVVLDSAAKDLTRVTDILLRGTFQSAGQNCIGIERIIATGAVYEEIVSRLHARIRNLRVGSILDDEEIDMGAMISDASFRRLDKLIQDAIRDGARLLCGGAQLHHRIHHHGHYFEPTLLVDVTSSMAIANEECFAPICVVMRAADATEACRIANAAPFGLGASVFGTDALETSLVAADLRTGMVSINDFAVYYVVQLPFGGRGGSGYGRFGGPEGLQGLCHVKAVCDDRFAWLGVRTTIPAILAYPVPHVGRGWGFAKGLIEFAHATGWKEVVKGLRGMFGW